MFKIEPPEQLFKIHHYYLRKDKGVELDIHVYELIAPHHDEKFLAIPTKQPITRHAPEKFHCQAKTEQEALQKCLAKIKDLSLDQIFEKKKD